MVFKYKDIFKYIAVHRVAFTIYVLSDLNKRNMLIYAYSFSIFIASIRPGRVAQSVGHLTRKSGVLGSIPGRATYFRFSFRFFKKGSCQLLAKICARSTC